MSKKTRTLLAVIVFELILAGIWFYLAQMGRADPQRVSPDFQSTLGTTMGAAMGALLGFGILLYIIAAQRDRKG